MRPRMHRRKSENMDNTLIPVWNPGRTSTSSNKHINPDISEAAKVKKIIIDNILFLRLFYLFLFRNDFYGIRSLSDDPPSATLTM